MNHVEDKEIFSRHAAFCAIFSSEVRLRIMWVLGTAEKTVTEIAHEVGISVTNASQHLRVMRDRSAVRTRKVEKSVYYRIANPKFLKGALLIREGLMEELGKGGMVSQAALDSKFFQGDLT